MSVTKNDFEIASQNLKKEKMPNIEHQPITCAQDVMTQAFENSVKLAEAVRDIVDVELQIKNLHMKKAILEAKRDRFLGITLSMNQVANAHPGE